MHLTCTNMPQDRLRDALDKVMLGSQLLCTFVGRSLLAVTLMLMMVLLGATYLVFAAAAVKGDWHTKHFSLEG